MKKEFSIWLSLVSLVLSVVATCVAVWRSPDLGFDYQGVLVGVVSLLVTVLIGWQIYSSVEIVKRIDNIEPYVTCIAKKEIEKQKLAVLSIALSLKAINLRDKNQDSAAIDSFINAISMAQKCEWEDALIISIGELYELVLGDVYKPPIFKGKRIEYIRILSKLEDKKAEKLIEFVYNAKEIDFTSHEQI